MGVVVGIIGVLLLIGYLSEHPVLAVYAGIGFVILIIAAIIQFKRDAKRLELKEIEAERKRIEFENDALIQIDSITQQHIHILALKQDQTVSQDDYGNYIVDKWLQALDYFIDNVLCKDDLVAAYLAGNVNGMDVETIGDIRRSQTRQLLVDAVSEYKIAQREINAHLSVDVESLDPIQYEHHCADLLRNSGWDTRVTQASSDQGIDVIASYGNIKAVLQCKKYSQPVGNAAVQEIIAGKQFEQAHVAAVVSNATFTQSAKQLANATGVFLLHHSELPELAARVGLEESEQSA